MKRSRRPWLRGLLLVAAVTSPLRAEISVGSATIALDPVPPGMNCPSERQLAAKVAAELTEMGNGAGSPRTRVRVQLAQNGAEVVAQVETGDPQSGQRHLTAPDCEILSDALALAIAVILDGQSARGAEASSRAVTATSQPQENHRRLSTPAERVNPATALRRFGGGFWLGGGVGSEPSALLAAGGKLEFDRFQARLAAWGQFLPVLEMAPGRVARQRFGGMAVGCVGWGRRMRLLACGHAWLGAEHYAGRGFAQSRSDTVFWGAAGPGIGVETGQRIRIGLDAVGLVSLMNDRYVASAAGTEHGSDAFAFWLLMSFGLSRQFGETPRL